MFQQAEGLALKLSKYRDTAAADTGKEEDSAKLLELYPLVERDSKVGEARFRSTLLLECVVAKAIEEEIIRLGNPPLEKSLKGQYEILLNQRILTGKALHSPVTRFLFDAVKFGRITKDQLLALLNLLTKESLSNEGAEQLNSKSSFAIALSNTMSLLNAAKYDFSNQEFSNISIPHANLSQGKFEGTTFSNVDLRRADFEGACLKKATFVKANMENVSFKETEDIQFNEKVESVAISVDKKHFAVDLGANTVLYKQTEGIKYNLREFKKLPGYFSGLGKSPFSVDGKKLLTIEGEKPTEENSEGEYSADEDSYREEFSEKNSEKDEEEREEGEGEDEEYDEDEEDFWMGNSGDKKKKKKKKDTHFSFAIWDVTSGESLSDFKVPIVPRRNISFSPDFKEFALFKGKKIEKYTVATGQWVSYPIEYSSKKITNCDVNNNLLLVGDHETKLRLCNSNTGRTILKQRQKVRHCKFSFDGKQIVSGTVRGYIQLSDSVRGCVTKQFLDPDDEYRKKIYSCSLSLDGKRVAATSGHLTLQDIIDGEFAPDLRSNVSDNAKSYALDPEYKHIAEVSRGGNRVTFKKISDYFKSEKTKSLELDGVVVSDCIGLSQADITPLQKKERFSIWDD